LFSTTLERKTCVFTKRVYLKLHWFNITKA
jgi:hypothetical protein